jgi:hypothetical protein
MQESLSLRQEQLARVAYLVVGPATTEVYEVVAGCKGCEKASGG